MVDVWQVINLSANLVLIPISILSKKQSTQQRVFIISQLSNVNDILGIVYNKIVN